MSLDSSNDVFIQQSSARKRKLRFDEGSIIETGVVVGARAKKGRQRGKFNNLSDVVVDDEELAMFLQREEEDKRRAQMEEFGDDYDAVLGNDNSGDSSITSEKMYAEKFGHLGSEYDFKF